MYIKLFIPVLLLSLLQLSSYYLYNGFSYQSNTSTSILVSFFYISFIFSILFFCFFLNNNYSYNLLKIKSVSKFDLFICFLVLIFITKPTLVMFGIGNQLGFDYVRANFFETDLIRREAFGNMFIAIFCQTYLVPFLWFYTIMMIDNNTKGRKFIFYFLLFSLILFNFSYAGRFYLYFSILVLYLKNLIDNNGFTYFLKKYSLILLPLFLVSILITDLRGSENIDEKNGLLILLEYHILQPFFLSQKIEYGDIVYNGYPFKTLVEGIFAPFYYFLGVGLNELPQGYLPIVFSKFTLYSNYSDSYFNAFATFFPYLYSDFGFFAPLFVFIYFIYFLFSSFLISNIHLRVKFLSFLSLMMYFSLFQAVIFSYGCLLIILFFPLLNYFSRKR